MARCEICNGTGVLTISATCPKCNGTAEIIIYEDDGTENMVNCPQCEDGLIYTEQVCHPCNGTGQAY